MKILVASDIHGRTKAAKRLAEVIDETKPDKIFLLGDLLYNGPRNGVPDDYEPMEVANILNAYADKISCVCGNCDSRVDAMVLHFPLPDHLSIQEGGKRFLLIHGDDYTLPFINPKEGDIVLSGHTHIQVLEKKDGIAYLNPGSTSFPKGGNEASYALIDDSSIEIFRLSDSKSIKKMKF